MVEVEWYALRIVVERGAVNFAPRNLESDGLNLCRGRSIPGLASDLRHATWGASSRPSRRPPVRAASAHRELRCLSRSHRPHLSTGEHVASYLGSVDEPIIAGSALKHGLRETEILHAYHHPIRAWDMGDGFTMLLGANQAALILEVGYIQGMTAIVIVHAMRAREKFLR